LGAAHAWAFKKSDPLASTGAFSGRRATRHPRLVALPCALLSYDSAAHRLRDGDDVHVSWAVVYVSEGIKALAEMGMFLGILSIGILYGWREGAFKWQ